jgi:hypothetical protein
MDITVTVCDKEGCKKKQTHRNEVYAGTESDPSGNGSNSWYRVFDLCPEHQKEWDRKGSGLEFTESYEMLKKLKIHYRVQ